jgi:hypothetical protein
MPKPRRVWKIVRRSFLLLLGVYLLLQSFPQLLFAHSVSYGNLILYSRIPLPQNANEILKKTDLLLSSSELYSTGHTRRIFVCDGYKLYWLLTSGERHSVGCSFPTTSKNVFIPKADFANDLALPEQWKSTDTRRRTLSGTIAHELTHVSIAEYLGRISYWRLTRKNAWVNEGYCDYIARSSSVSLDSGVNSVLTTPYDSLGISYVRSRLMIAHLINDEHLSMKDILKNPPDGRKVSEEVVEKLRHDPVIDPASIEPTR